MRVTQQALQDSWIQSIQGRLGSIDRINKQIGSGSRVAKPADDPSGANRIVRIEELVARGEQYLRNIEEALGVQRATESALNQAYEGLVRVKSLAVSGANDASDPTSGSLLSMAAEVEGIKTSLLQVALSQYQGEYLFTGTAGDVAPFDAGGGAYRGDANMLHVNMGNGQTVAVNLPGDIAFREPEVRGETALPDILTLGSDLVFEIGDGSARITVTVMADQTGDGVPDPYTRQALVDTIQTQFQQADLNLETRASADGFFSFAIANSAEGGEITVSDPSGDLAAVLGISPGTKNVFGLLDDLQAAMESQDSRRVAAFLDRIDRALDSLVGERGRLGSRQRNLEFARSRLVSLNVTNETLRAEIEGVDIPEAVTKLTAEEQAYQIALAAGARIFNVSILDFLR